METDEIISKDKHVHSGDLVFSGTRVPISRIVAYLKKGYTLDRFLEGFPSVRREQAEAFLDFALQQAEKNLEAKADARAD